MSAQSGMIEVTGADVEAAIARGLAQLRVNREKVTIEVLDEGSRGLLGLGRRDAVVRLRLREAPATPAPPKPVEKPASPGVEPPPAAKAAPPAAKPAPPLPRVEPASPPVAKAALPPKPVPPSPAAEDEGEEAPVGDLETDDQRQEEAKVAVTVWQTLLQKLHIDAEVGVDVSEPDDVTGRQINIIELRGRDLSALIGPRGETLDAMQYVTRLMVAHQLKRRVDFVVDVEGYRDRRSQALSRLAERMARKALKRGRPVTLEPMSPSERRVIHMALRDYEGVYTESTGEGKGRRVRILLK
ncbi:MAG: hypothetical protein Fur0021_39740 [Candidatus Promineifilaceae bacterium]